MEDTHRWSELIPPQTALTFAAIWDPKEGMVTFSGLGLLDSEISPDSDSTYTFQSPRFHRRLQDYAPRDAVDTQSQVLTIDLLANALMVNTPNSEQVIAAIQERDRTREQRRGTVAFGFNSHAIDDHGSVTDPFWKRNVRYKVNEYGDSCYGETYGGNTDHKCSESRPVQERMKAIGSFLLAAAKTPLDGRIFGRPIPPSRSSSSSEEEEDSGFFEEVPLTATAASYYSAPLLVNLNLKSTFSVTTTSTTNYIDVDRPSVCQSGHHHLNEHCDTSEVWSTLRNIYNSPNGSGTAYIPSSSPFDFPVTHHHLHTCPQQPTRRRLQKPRSRHQLATVFPPAHRELPAKPEEVLAREEYNHEIPPSPIPSSPSVYSTPSFTRLAPASHSPTTPTAPILRRKKSFAKARKVILDKLTKCTSVTGAKKEEDGYTGWVRIDVTQKVTQRVLS